MSDTGVLHEVNAYDVPRGSVRVRRMVVGPYGVRR